jgi:hypothetical protein
MVNTYSLESEWDVADAVYTAATHMTPGDVILLEQQTEGPDNGRYVPVEWTPSVYDAIKLATAAKIIVIEAAGNGGVNLSDPLYGTSFPSGKADSGAIIVGAGSACGTSPSHYRTSSSNYGARVNMQGNGECVATTGYANYYGSTATNNSYTNSFNGTSAASALVAAAAAAVSSSYEALYKVAATSATVKNAIKSTGTAQDITVNPGNIGPLPNLVAAIKSLDKIAPTVPQAVSVSLNTYNQPLVKWTASTDNTGVTKYKIYRSGTLIATTGAVIQYLDRTAAAHTSYTYQIRAVDGVGNMSAKSVIVSITTR